MLIHRCRQLAGLLAGAALIAVGAGCGGSSSASSGAPRNAAAQSAPRRSSPRAPTTVPQAAVRSYLEGLQSANGTLICNVLDETLERAMIKKIVSVRPTEATATCEQALARFAAAVTAPSERHLKVPALHVTRAGDRAVVRYRGALSHEPRSFTLVKEGSGWLIDKINAFG
jgi:hypothetical protein